MAALDGTVALVTGGSSGIGLATVRRLEAEGATVVIADLRPPATAAGQLFLEVDVGDADAWDASIRLIEETFGGLDAGFLNAGVTTVAGSGTGAADITAVEVHAYRRVMRVNVDGVFFGLRALVPALRRRGGGAVVATASLAGLTGFAVDPVYTASKHAVVGLVRAVAPVLEPHGIRVNAVCPGIVETPLIGDDASQLRLAGFPLLQPDDIARVVMEALLSDRSGVCWAVQPGREPVAYRFAGIPGPRVPGAEGMVPPLSSVLPQS